VGQALAEAGGSLQDVTRTRVMLTDIAHWKDAARAHGEVFGAIRPACTVVQVTGFINPDWLVEIEADAIIEPD
jgi:enamine deaminase RidA (YjgF/YER057c/UK114 family)